ncbi:MAG: hypothetical protein DHS20C18_47580 [Saprospiraceae bacterium]|nr:MAG: hypothetical protein DHS20C18_47580 [Saprospiraceae bacterium]
MLKKPTFPSYETARLILREINPKVRKILFKEFDNQQLGDFFGTSSVLELLDLRYRYEVVMVHNGRQSFRHWLLIDKATGRGIGDAGFHLWMIPHRRAELGYGIQLEEDKHKGLMTEALEKIINIGFADMNLERIEAFVEPTNLASLSLIRKFGFKGEGYMRKRYVEKGETQDLSAFGLLKSEYQGVLSTGALEQSLALVTAFEQRTLPEAMWTHQAHLTLGLWYLYQYTKAEALCRLRSGIISYNLSVGKKNTTSGGYHETLTLFWIEIIHQFLQQFGKNQPFKPTLHTFLESPLAHKDLPLQYYSREKLFTVEARGGWVCPDLKEI